jgi:tRNA threonylcarbamoyladenosine biosynthesis protein TsaB
LHGGIQSLNLLAVAQGPGSFTGLRVGVTLAKTLAYALQLPVVGIDTLEVLAEQARESCGIGGRLQVIMDAQRQEFFTATFQATASPIPLQRLGETKIISRADWLASLIAGDVVNGPPLENIAAELPSGFIIPASSLQRPLARTVGVLAYRAFHRGEAGDLWKLLPNYFRPSYAEEKRPAVSSSEH